MKTADIVFFGSLGVTGLLCPLLEYGKTNKVMWQQNPPCLKTWADKNPLHGQIPPEVSEKICCCHLGEPTL